MNIPPSIQSSSFEQVQSQLTNQPELANFHNLNFDTILENVKRRSMYCAECYQKIKLRPLLSTSVLGYVCDWPKHRRSVHIGCCDTPSGEQCNCMTDLDCFLLSTYDLQATHQYMSKMFGNDWNTYLLNTVAALVFGNQKFRMRAFHDRNCIKVDFTRGYPLAVHHRLCDQLQQILDERLFAMLADGDEGGGDSFLERLRVLRVIDGQMVFETWIKQKSSPSNSTSATWFYLHIYRSSCCICLRETACQNACYRQICSWNRGSCSTCKNNKNKCRKTSFLYPGSTNNATCGMNRAKYNVTVTTTSIVQPKLQQHNRAEKSNFLLSFGLSNEDRGNQAVADALASTSTHSLLNFILVVVMVLRMLQQIMRFSQRSIVERCVTFTSTFRQEKNKNNKNNRNHRKTLNKFSSARRTGNAPLLVIYLLMVINILSHHVSIATSATPSFMPTSSRPTAGARYIDMNASTVAGFQLAGVEGGEQMGFSLSSVGDVNNDGLPDILTGAPGRGGNGMVYLLFGKAEGLASLNLTTFVVSDGIRIYGKSSSRIGETMSSGAGDFNGDGIDDFIIGDYKQSASSPSRSNVGVVVMLFGKTSGWADIYLSSFTASSSLGFRIIGRDANDLFGYSVSSAGDVNGDGYADIIIGAEGANPSNRDNAGKAYVFYGHSNTSSPFADIDLVSYTFNTTTGFEVRGPTANDKVGISVTGGLDLNNDTYSDVAVASNNGYEYIIFGGQSLPISRELSLLISGSQNWGFLVYTDVEAVLGSAGDINADGIDDLIIGCPGHGYPIGRPGCGIIFILFGKPHGSSFQNLLFSNWITPTDGFQIYGTASNDRLGYSVGGGVDINADGVVDLVLGANSADPYGRSNAGTVTIVFGKKSSSWQNIDTANIAPDQGFQIFGAVENDAFGISVALSRDMNGDGIGEILIGANGADPGGRMQAGQVTVIYGQMESPTAIPTFPPTLRPTAEPSPSPQPTPGARYIDLYEWQNNSALGFQVAGAGAGNQLGSTVCSAGDVNGDGYADLLVGAPSSNSAYLIFGKAGGPADVHTASASFGGVEGIKIFGIPTLGYSVSGVGDFNGDGIDDFLVGAINYDASLPSRDDGGMAVILLGKTTGWDDIDMSSFTASNSLGFRLMGANNYDHVGWSASPAGDLNGDGYADVIIGADDLDFSGRGNAGGAYVLYGHSNSSSPFTDIDLAHHTLNSTTGFEIRGAIASQKAGKFVTGGFDLNNDSYSDIAISAANNYVYVIFGKNASYDTIDLAGLSGGSQRWGFRVAASGEMTLSPAGDINGDGIDDMIIGSSGASYSVRIGSGMAYIIYGKNQEYPFDNLDVSSWATPMHGVRVYGTATYDRFGKSVGGGFDINADGVSDVVISADRADPYSRSNAGTITIVFGRSAGIFEDIDTANIAPDIGFQIFGAVAGDYFGSCVALSSDMNGDGIGEIVMASPLADANNQNAAGAVVVLYGQMESPTFQPSSLPSAQPSSQPTAQPSCQPFAKPSAQPSSQPTTQPSCQPFAKPSAQPSSQPTTQPSFQPFAKPSAPPSAQPSALPSAQPSVHPSLIPTSQPSSQPSVWPTGQPSMLPTCSPSAQPSSRPSTQPSGRPTMQPSSRPTNSPTTQPSSQPSSAPSTQPSATPSTQPSAMPTAQPSTEPSSQPSAQPSVSPSGKPSRQPSAHPSAQPSSQPTSSPTRQPSSQPSSQPTSSPTRQPSSQPSSQPTSSPTRQPSSQPSSQPTSSPTRQPSSQPSSQPTSSPTRQPSADPTSQPIAQPSSAPSAQPSVSPSTLPSSAPSSKPSSGPTTRPSIKPSGQPSTLPSTAPSSLPSSEPSTWPTSAPSCQPTTLPSAQPSRSPSVRPSAQPSHKPSTEPSAYPSSCPTSMPSYSHAPTIFRERNWTAQIYESSLVSDVAFLDGKTFACGGTLSAFCLKFDNPTGQLSSVAALPWDQINSIVAVDSNLVVVGQWNGGSHYVIARFNVLGVLLDWGFRTSPQLARLTAVIFHKNTQQIISAGYNDNRYVVAAALDKKDGGLLWGFTYQISGLNAYATSVEPLPGNAGSCLAGYVVDTFNGYKISVLVMNIDMFGTLSSINILELDGGRSAQAIGLAVDAISGDAIIAGIAFYSNAVNALITRVSNSGGGIYWAKEYSSAANDQFTDVIWNDDGVFVIGYSEGFDTSGKRRDLIVLHLNAESGEVITSARISGPGSITCTALAAFERGLRIACTAQDRATLFFLDKNTLVPGDLPSGYSYFRDVESVMSSATSSGFSMADTSAAASSKFTLVKRLLTQSVKTTSWSSSALQPLLNMAVPSPSSYTQSWPENMPSHAPTRVPTIRPSTRVPTIQASAAPSIQPSSTPSSSPSASPTIKPSISCQPTGQPSSSVPTITFRPMSAPSHRPSRLPSQNPTRFPTLFPTMNPSPVPSCFPTAESSAVPTITPSTSPTSTPPTLYPSPLTSARPSALKPSAGPTTHPSAASSFPPTHTPTTTPSAATVHNAGQNATMWGAIGGSGGGVLVLLLIGVFMRRRHLAEQEQLKLRKVTPQQHPYDIENPPVTAQNESNQENLTAMLSSAPSTLTRTTPRVVPDTHKAAWQHVAGGTGNAGKPSKSNKDTSRAAEMTARIPSVPRVTYDSASDSDDLLSSVGNISQNGYHYSLNSDISSQRKGVMEHHSSRSSRSSRSSKNSSMCSWSRQSSGNIIAENAGGERDWASASSQYSSHYSDSDQYSAEHVVDYQHSSIHSDDSNSEKNENNNININDGASIGNNEKEEETDEDDDYDDDDYDDDDDDDYISDCSTGE